MRESIAKLLGRKAAGSLPEQDRGRSEADRMGSRRLALAFSQAALAVQQARTSDDVYNAVLEEVGKLGLLATMATLTRDRKRLVVTHLAIENTAVRAAEKLTGISAKNFSIPIHPGGVYDQIISKQETVYSEQNTEFIAEALPHVARPLAGQLAALLGIKEAIYAPLAIGGEVRGLLTISGAGLGEGDSFAVTAFASQTSIALENVRLYESARQELAERERAEEALQRSEERYRGLFQSSPVALWEEDCSEVKEYIDELRASGVEDFRLYFENHPEAVRACASRVKVIDVNQATLNLYGATNKEELEGRLDRVFVEESYDTFRNELIAMAEGEILFEDITRARALNGQERDIALTWRVVQGFEETLSSVLVADIDITERKRVEDALRESEEKYRALFEQSRDAVFITNSDGRFLDANQSFLTLFGYSREEMVRLSTRQLYSEPSGLRGMQEDLDARGSVVDFESRLRDRDGTEMDCLITASVRRGKDGSLLGYQGIVRDITERKQAAETIRRLAYYDGLTGLPNRMLFRDRLAVAMAQARRSQQALAVLLLDLDDFKEVNDSLGHSAGDRLLQAMGERLSHLVREGDTVSRLGGDEFLLVLPQTSAQTAWTVAQRILMAIKQPLAIEGQRLRITASIGIAEYPVDGRDADTLVRRADKAMYRAKALGRDCCQRYGRLPTLELEARCHIEHGDGNNPRGESTGELLGMQILTHA